MPKASLVHAVSLAPLERVARRDLKVPVVKPEQLVRLASEELQAQEARQVLKDPEVPLAQGAPLVRAASKAGTV